MSAPQDGGPANDMTLRDYFAAAALQGILANPNYPAYSTWSQDAQSAYTAADAMLAERARTKEAQS